MEVFTLTFSLTFWIITLVFAMFLCGILTASYNDDKTKGL
ncbi:hypothetical protein J25TS5_33000 [Paenibacillus faecis]|nr:hypothetical protein J25TS5_33000 [Paenibacillus faecis]